MKSYYEFLKFTFVGGLEKKLLCNLKFYLCWRDKKKNYCEFVNFTCVGGLKRKSYCVILNFTCVGGIKEKVTVKFKILLVSEPRRAKKKKGLSENNYFF